VRGGPVHRGGEKLKFGRQRGFPGMRFCWGSSGRWRALDLVLGRSGGAMEVPDAGELEQPAIVTLAGCLHGERKGISRQRRGLLIAPEWGGARGSVCRLTRL
jgi:hypothetical protein